MTGTDRATLTLLDIERCFGGAIPAVLATATAAGEPNVTYISRAHRIDAERLALSNQFMSKTSRNLASNPRASLLLMDPLTHDEYRLSIVYERTERRGPVFEQLRTEIDAIARLQDMRDVFRLRAADVFRVVDIVQLPPHPSGVLPDDIPVLRAASPVVTELADFAAAVGRAADLDVLVEVALEGLDRLFGFRHTLLLLVDESGTQLYTIASRGFDVESVGTEVAIGSGMIGLAAERCSPLRVDGLRQMEKYARAIRQRVAPGREVPVPNIVGVQSRIVVPAIARGELVAVIVAESRHPVAFGRADEELLAVVGPLLGSAIEHVRHAAAGPEDAVAPAPPVDAATMGAAPTDTAATGAATIENATTIRFFTVDGSVFVDDEYLIKGVAGRILWSLLGQHVASGRTDFTNRELRLDPSLDLPGFKDNLESRLILLKRRLDERQVPIRIERTGRGRFRLEVSTALRLDATES